MCFRNCENENWHGECQMGKYPENFICPDERAVCIDCEQTFDVFDSDEGLCPECQEGANE